jgi:SsrA-binding protein
MDSSKPDLLAENRRARFDYDIIDYYVAGIELEGHEVKSVKTGHGSLQGSYVIIRGGEAWLINCTIPAYQQNNVPPEYDPSRTRRVLLKKDEIKELQGTLKEKSIALLPLKFFSKGGLVKVELGVGRARKDHDKRDLLKKRDAEREMRRE